jgi:hypothetical protein
MGIINIKDLKPKMVLLGDIKDCRGRLLISKGTVLNDNYLKICKMWGVVEADVQGVSPEDLYASAINSFDAAAVTAAEQIVQERFCHNDMTHPAIRELVRLSTLRIASGRRPCLETDQDDDAAIQRHKEELDRIRKRIPLNVNTAQYIGDTTKLSTLPAIYRQIIDAISNPPAPPTTSKRSSGWTPIWRHGC